MIIAAIVVTDKKNAIGKENKLLCHLPADLKYFKATTLGYPVIMGRKTYESIGRLLPKRRNIIVSRKKDYSVAGAEIHSSIDSAVKSCSEDKVFIIGGSEIYTQSLPVTQEIYRTVIHEEFEADTWFPPFEEQFTLADKQSFEADEQNKHAYSFEKWLRKQGN
jgi:dihydrofolate reductase